MEAAITQFLLREINDVCSRLNLLRAGAIMHPVMDEAAETRFGRVVAAQLTALAIREHLWFSYSGESHRLEEALLATRHPAPSDVPDADEQRLLDLIFAGAEVTRIGRSRPGRAWDEMTTAVHEGLKADGYGWTRRERYRLMRRLVGLRKAMRQHALGVPGPEGWRDAPDLHRAGYPLAVLFNIDTGAYAWPSAPEAEFFVPSLLPAACHIAIINAT